MDKALIKQFGEAAFITGSQLKTEEGLVSVSPRLDIILGGGIPKGSFVNISGPPKGGKTSLALAIARNAQKQDCPIYYFNIEGRIKQRDLDGVKDLDLNNFNIVRSYWDEEKGEAKILSAEEYLQIAEHILKSVPYSVLIFDSVSQLAAEEEVIDDLGKRHRAPGAVLMAQFCRRVSNTVPVNSCIVISILHIIANTGNYGASQYESGGNKVKYACDVGLRCKGFKVKRPGGKEDDEGTKPPYGQEITWQTWSTALNAVPCQTITGFLRYGIGIDNTLEILQLASDTGLITKSGSWYTLDYTEDKKKIQGEENLYQHFVDQVDEVEKLHGQIKEMIFGN